MRPHFLIPLLLASAAHADMTDLIAEFATADIIILGEIHDNPHHHAIQAEITAAIQPSGLVFEMFSPEQARIVNALRWEGAGIESLEEDLEWAKTGWPSFDFYAQIIEADPEGVVFGGSAPIENVRAAISEGAAKMFGEGAEIYGADQVLPPDQQSLREANQMEAHCNALPESMLSGMVEAQRLRDITLADSAFRALGEVGAPIIIIAGNGHARDDWGIPAALRYADPDITIMTLGQLEAEPVETLPYTRFWVSDPAEREDPCLDFKG